MSLITPERLKAWKALPLCNRTGSLGQCVDDALDTIEVLWKVAEAAEDFCNETECKDRESANALNPLVRALTSLHYQPERK